MCAGAGHCGAMITSPLNTIPTQCKPTLGDTWVQQAACATVDPEIFFPKTPRYDSSYDKARTICQQCPVKDTCLEATLMAEESLTAHGRHGMFGGMSPQERSNLATQRSRFRAKNRR